MSRATAFVAGFASAVVLKLLRDSFQGVPEPVELDSQLSEPQIRSIYPGGLSDGALGILDGRLDTRDQVINTHAPSVGSPVAEASAPLDDGCVSARAVYAAWSAARGRVGEVDPGAVSDVADAGAPLTPEEFERQAQRTAAMLRQARALTDRAREINEAQASVATLDPTEDLDDRVEPLDNRLGQPGTPDRSAVIVGEDPGTLSPGAGESVGSGRVEPSGPTLTHPRPRAFGPSIVEGASAGRNSLRDADVEAEARPWVANELHHRAVREQVAKILRSIDDPPAPQCVPASPLEVLRLARRYARAFAAAELARRRTDLAALERTREASALHRDVYVALLALIGPGPLTPELARDIGCFGSYLYDFAVALADYGFAGSQFRSLAESLRDIIHTVSRELS